MGGLRSSQFWKHVSGKSVGLFLLLAVLAPGIATPAAPQATPEDGGKGIVREIVDGNTLVIEMTETASGTPDIAKPGSQIQIRLVGIQAPKLALGRPNVKPWPLAEESKAALSELAINKTLRLTFGGQKIDRHGRLLAQLYRDDGLWIQGEMIGRGMARVYTFADNRMLADDLYKREREARDAKRGIWADPFYAVRKPEQMADEVGSFQLVEGQIKSAAVVHSRGFLNFGADWKKDFTAVIDPSAQALFRRAKIDIAELEGKRLRVRGWVSFYHRPEIEITHPEQIEVLEP